MDGYFDLLRVVRVPILVGGALGYILGVLLGVAMGGVVDAGLVALCYTVVALGDLSTHFSNDYYDVECDRLSLGKTFGGSNVLVARSDLVPYALVSAEVLSTTSVALSFVAVLFGVSALLIPLAVGANILGWSYSARLRLAHRGLGEAAIAIGTGFGVPAAGYLAVKGSLDTGFMATSAALVLLGFVLSLYLELPDGEADKACGKMNLVARFGAVACTRLALFLCLGSTTMLLLFGSTALCSASLVPLATVALGNLFCVRRCQPNTISTVCILSLYAFLIVSVVLLVIQL